MTTAGQESRRASILVVDDEPIVRDSLAAWLSDDGHRVDVAGGADEALRLASTRPYDLAFVDIKMPGTSGLELQKRLTAEHPDLVIVVMTAYASVESAVRAMKAGAYDYVTKPFQPEDLSRLVLRSLEHRQLKSENRRLKASLHSSAAAPRIIGESPAIVELLAMIDTVADADSTVLVRGESGTGKELVARAIHARSARRWGPLVIVNCGALPESLLESELFGHEKGSFTGATDRRRGRFEQADGGTLFLDEIGAVSQRVPVGMLRALEEKMVTRVGGESPIATDFCVLAATNQPLEELVERGEFRDDLYWRLNVFTLDIPPLRERPQDVPLLAEHFLEQFARSMNRPPLRLAPAALAALGAYSWPGNVRELQNAIERAVVVGSPPQIELTDLPLRIVGAVASSTPLSLAAVERAHIRSVLEACRWNVSRAARVLELDRGTLYNKIRKHGFERPKSA